MLSPSLRLDCAWSTTGASAVGIRYYLNDYPEVADLDEALQAAIGTAEQSGLSTLLLGEFGADGSEGTDGAAAQAQRVGALAGLARSVDEASEKGGAVALGCWDGSSDSLQRLRAASFSGLVLKNACQGDISWGAKIKHPSLAALSLTKLVKAAMSKGDSKIWGGAGGVGVASTGPMESAAADAYFNRDNQRKRL